MHSQVRWLSDYSLSLGWLVAHLYVLMTVLNADGSTKSVVPITFNRMVKGESFKDDFAGKLEQGTLWFYSGPAAIDGNGDFYLSLGSCGPTAIVKYDRETKSFDPKVRLDSCRGLNVYEFDPEAVYVTSSFQIHRFVFPDSEETEAVFESKFEAASHLALQGKRHEIWVETQAITANRWLVSLLNTESKSYRTLFIDFELRSFQNIPQLNKRIAMGINKVGDLVCLSGADVLTFRLDGRNP